MSTSRNFAQKAAYISNKHYFGSRIMEEKLEYRFRGLGVLTLCALLLRWESGGLAEGRLRPAA